jgi:glycine/D-amino acid oxidase-like deaminating enzyme
MTPLAPSEMPDLAALQNTVLVVGSGIAGLMTAYHAAEAGYSVCILSKSPDPRSADRETPFDAATWDGYVSRFITLTQGHPHFDCPGYLGALYPEMRQDCQTDVTQGGILALPLDQWDDLSRQFLQERDRTNPNKNVLLRSFYDYLDENRTSLEMWYELLTEVLLRKPQVLDTISLHSNGIDQFYDQPDVLRAALSAHSDQQVVKAGYSVSALLKNRDFRVYWQGIRQHGLIQGGFTLYGLAFDVQALARDWLLTELEDRGVGFCFGAEHEVIRIERDGLGAIVGLTTQNGTLHSAKHIFMHPGAYLHPNVLEGTEAYGKLAGVKGLWMRIKNAQERFGDARYAPRPNKIHSSRYEVTLAGKTYRGQITDLSIMPKFNPDGTWELIISSGFIFVGVYPFAGDARLGALPDPAAEKQRQQQIKLIEELALRAFAQVVSKVYDLPIDVEAVLEGYDRHIDIPARGCVRSWSPDGRELRVIQPTTAQGILLIEGGGNTGTTTKAPFIAKTAVSFARSLDASEVGSLSLTVKQLTARYEAIRQELRKTSAQLPPHHWYLLEQTLNQAVNTAKIALVPLLFERFRSQLKRQKSQQCESPQECS